MTDATLTAPSRRSSAPTPAPISPIRRELITLLICPEDHQPLSGWDGIQPDGALVCASCGRSYAVRGGIPCLLPAALREAKDAPAEPQDQSEIAEKRREMAARDAQVGDYDRMVGLKLFTNVELPATFRYLQPMPEHLMLEGGCGTGRMTPAFADRCRGLVAVDFSAESIAVAKTKLTPDQADKVLFLQADLSRLPLQTEAFDRVGSFGVYEHIPTADARDRAIGEMTRVLKPREQDGRMALSAYRWGPPVSWMSEREGHHDGGIYFRRFTLSELTGLLAPRLQVLGATQWLLYYHLVWGRKHAAAAAAER